MFSPSSISPSSLSILLTHPSEELVTLWFSAKPFATQVLLWLASLTSVCANRLTDLLSLWPVRPSSAWLTDSWTVWRQSNWLVGTAHSSDLSDRLYCKSGGSSYISLRSVTHCKTPKTICHSVSFLDQFHIFNKTYFYYLLFLFSEPLHDCRPSLSELKHEHTDLSLSQPNYFQEHYFINL